MTPLDYIRENVSITSTRKLLYNCIFNKFKMDIEDDHEYERKLSGEVKNSTPKVKFTVKTL